MLEEVISELPSLFIQSFCFIWFARLSAKLDNRSETFRSGDERDQTGVYFYNGCCTLFLQQSNLLFPLSCD